MNIRSCVLFVCLSVVTIMAGCHRAPTQTFGDIEIDNPWVRAMAPNAPAAGGFVILRNTGNAADRLVSARTADAEVVEIHEVRTEEGVMRMRPLDDGLLLPASSMVELKPGAQHLMLVAPHRRLAEGETVTIALDFERAGTVEVRFPVMPIAATSGGSPHH